LSIYLYYLRAAGGLTASFTLVVTGLGISALWLFQNYTLGVWMQSMQYNASDSVIAHDLSIYLLTVALVVFAYLFRSLLQMVCSITAAQVCPTTLFGLIIALNSRYSHCSIG
jgi:hypothetical protein